MQQEWEIFNMNTKVIVIKTPDNGVVILHPASEMFNSNSRTRATLREQGIDFANDDEVLDWIINKDVPAGASYRITEITNLPSDRHFRAAWTDAKRTKTVDVDMPKAREVHLNNLRRMREPKFTQLDRDYLRADERNDLTEKQRIAGLKQQLRDIPQTLDLSIAKTPEELKAIVPAILV